jgi:DNA end-binding protein Ku
MAARSSWKGYLKLSLVSVPVKGYTAARSAGEVRLNQLHEKCHNRIRYQKVCPIHGEVPKEEIVSGYEYAKGQYVVIDPDEMASLRKERDRAVTIDGVVQSGKIDPVYFTDKTYYLLPDGAVGQKPFALIQKCLEEEKLQAVGRVVLFGREELVVVRGVDGILAMTALKYDAEVTPADTFREELEPTDLEPEELQLTKTLLKAFVKPKFTLAGYKDKYVEELAAFIEAKVEGKEIVTPPAAEEPRIINLMEALKRSVAEAKGSEAAPHSKRKMAASARKTKSKPTKSAKPKRKSG